MFEFVARGGFRVLVPARKVFLCEIEGGAAQVFLVGDSESQWVPAERYEEIRDRLRREKEGK